MFRVASVLFSRRVAPTLNAVRLCSSTVNGESMPSWRSSESMLSRRSTEVHSEAIRSRAQLRGLFSRVMEDRELSACRSSYSRVGSRNPGIFRSLPSCSIIILILINTYSNTQTASFHEVNSHMVDCHVVNSRVVNLSRGQLVTRSTPTKSISVTIIRL